MERLRLSFSNLGFFTRTVGLGALGTEAAMQGYRVKYTLATKLVNELVEAADDKQLTKTIARYGRVDLLCIDELGCAPRGADVSCERRCSPLVIAVIG